MKKIILSILLLSSLMYANLLNDGLNAAKNGNYKKAAKLWKKAANQGVAAAQYNLGGLYYNGQGVRQNKSKAKKLYGNACDGGYEPGCHNYKILNEQGI